MASPGMMQSGLSRELFELWCTDAKNGVIIAGTSQTFICFFNLYASLRKVENLDYKCVAYECLVDY